MSWAELFDRAEEYGRTVDEVRDALAARRETSGD
jgi:hypothetical protein